MRALLILRICAFVCRFNHELVFGVTVKNLSKAERLIYGDSLMTHAMILTAVTDKVQKAQHRLGLYRKLCNIQQIKLSAYHIMHIGILTP